MPARATTSFISTLLDAVFATRCVLCNHLGRSCCQDCWSRLAYSPREVHRVSASGHKLSGFATIDFDPKVATLVHAFKDQNRTALATQFAEAMVTQVEALASAEATAVHLVPVPSRLSSIQQRGFSPGAEIAKNLLARLDHTYRPGSHLVWRFRESADQAALGQSERKENLVGTMKASRQAANANVVLVDDIVTTGSSLFETARALEAEGANILGFVTFSETILRNIGKTHTKDSKKV